MRQFVVYECFDRVFVTTPECEALFVKQAKDWGYNLDDDFDRHVVTDVCVMIEPKLSVS